MAVDSAGDWGWDVVEDSVGDCRGGHGQVCLEFQKLEFFCDLACAIDWKYMRV